MALQESPVAKSAWIATAANESGAGHHAILEGEGTSNAMLKLVCDRIEHLLGHVQSEMGSLLEAHRDSLETLLSKFNAQHERALSNLVESFEPSQPIGIYSCHAKPLHRKSHCQQSDAHPCHRHAPNLAQEQETCDLPSIVPNDPSDCKNHREPKKSVPMLPAIQHTKERYSHISIASEHTSGNRRNSDLDDCMRVLSASAQRKLGKRSHMSMKDRAGTDRFLALEDYRKENGRCSLRQFVRSNIFACLSGCMILCQPVLSGVEADHMSRNLGNSSTIDTVAFVLNTWYVLEIVLRFAAEGMSLFSNNERFWNVFDLVLVLTSIADLILEAVSSGDEVGAARLIRIVRLFRILRALRMIRYIVYIRELRKLVYSLAISAPTLFWATSLLFCVVYVFAIWFTQGVAAVVQSTDSDEAYKNDLEKHFGSVVASIVSLYHAISNGVEWGEMYSILVEAHWGLALLFLFYVTVCILGITNVITSVFVESAMQSSQHFKEILMEEKRASRQVIVAHLQDLFLRLDTDKSNTVSKSELEHGIQDPASDIYPCFQALDIHADDANALFKLLDSDKSGEVDIQEFCDGCMRLKGEARSFDIQCIIYDIHRLHGRTARILELLESSSSDPFRRYDEPAQLS